MKKMTIYLISTLFLFSIAWADDFSLFEPVKELDKKVFTDLKPNQLFLTYYGYPRDVERIGLGYEYFFNKKIAIMGESLYKTALNEEIVKGEYERLETNLGLTYRLTHRMVGPIFFAKVGLSANNDYIDRGFAINSAFLQLAAHYSWNNGLGVEYKLGGKFPFETIYHNSNTNSISLIYIF